MFDNYCEQEPGVKINCFPDKPPPDYNMASKVT